MDFHTGGQPIPPGTVLCRRCNRASTSSSLAAVTGWIMIGIKVVSPKEGEFHWGMCPDHSKVTQ